MELLLTFINVRSKFSARKDLTRVRFLIALRRHKLNTVNAEQNISHEIYYIENINVENYI